MLTGVHELCALTERRSFRDHLALDSSSPNRVKVLESMIGRCVSRAAVSARGRSGLVLEACFPAAG